MVKRKTDMTVSLPESIDRNSYEPAYAQLANILLEQISMGVFCPGDQLPAESELCQRFQISPMTVRRAINFLAEKDVVSAERGRGTFVKPLDLRTATFQLEGLHDLFGEKDMSIKLLDARIVKADNRIARFLEITEGDNTVYIRRLLTRKGEPTYYHREHLVYDPTRPIIESEMDVTSLNEFFDGAGTRPMIKRGELTIKATVMSEEEAGLLKMSTSAAAFHLEHIFYDFDEAPISWGWFICPGERLRFTTTVGIKP